MSATVSIYDTDRHKALRAECRKAHRNVVWWLEGDLYTERKDLYEHVGSNEDLDASVKFVYESPLHWLVTVWLRYDGTMPIRVELPDADGGESQYVKECRNAIALDNQNPKPLKLGHDCRWDWAVPWLEANLP